MRFLQNSLLLIGATAFGLGLGTVGTYFGLTLVLPEPKGEQWGGAVIWLLLTAGAGVVGTLVGFVGALRWILRHERRSWPPRVWIGLGIGGAIGFGITYATSARYFWWFWLARAAFFVPLCCAVGAVLGRLAFRPPSPKKKSKSKQGPR